MYLYSFVCVTVCAIKSETPKEIVFAVVRMPFLIAVSKLSLLSKSGTIIKSSALNSLSVPKLIFGIIIGHGLSILIFSIFKRILSLSKYYRIRLIPRALGLAVLSVFVATFYSMISLVEKLYKLNPIRALKMSDEYENKYKKLKGKRGRLLTKLFGVETGYAYKNILRNKKRFLLLVTTLTVWTVLASAIFTIISIAKKALYDELAPNCDYAGFVEIYNRESADGFIASLKELDEVKKVTYMESIFVSDKQNQNLRYLGYGFSRGDFLNFP